MFFRRHKPKVLSFRERVDTLVKAGFEKLDRGDGSAQISKGHVAAVVAEEGSAQPAIHKAGVLIHGEICVLLNQGYQMFLESPGGKKYPAQAEQLRALHQFEDDVKEALGLTNLYNTSLGTTSQKHMYDRVNKRDSGQQPKPWEHKDHRIKAPETKGSLHI